MNKFKYYLEMAQGKLKQKNLEKLEIIAIINNQKPSWKLYKNEKFLELEGDNGKKFNKLLSDLVDKLSEIKNNIVKDNEKIEKFKSKLEMYMKNFINEFVILYNYAAENGNKKEKQVETLEIKAIVPINNAKAIITMDLDNLEITIEKK